MEHAHRPRDDIQALLRDFKPRVEGIDHQGTEVLAGN